MAVITSTQSGDFDAGSTWVGGSAPSDGDQFVIATGHTVTIDSASHSVSAPTNGFHDSSVNGILKMIGANASNKALLHMNGKLTITTNGTLWQRPHSEILIKGTKGNRHGLVLNNSSAASWIAEGSDPTPTTTTSSAKVVRDMVLPVADASDFAVGEWIAVWYNGACDAGDTGDSSKTKWLDEGMWIHDINGNDIYFREFVGPEDTSITSVSGKVLTLSNTTHADTKIVSKGAKKFPVGQRVIFGTGSNRNATYVTAQSGDTITVNDTINGSVVGEKIYWTGLDRDKPSGSRVRKMATVTTAATNGGNNTITVADATGIIAGDVLSIEARAECGASGGTAEVNDVEGWQTSPDTWRYNDRYTVQSVSNNVITLTGNVEFNVVLGALVVKVNRDVVVGARTFGTDCPYVYAVSYTSNFTRKLILKDVWFKGVGNSTTNTESGLVFRGYFSTNDGADGDGGDEDGSDWTQNTQALPVTVSIGYIKDDRSPYIEGIVYDGGDASVSSAAGGSDAGAAQDDHIRDHSGIWLWDSYNTQVRCGVVRRSNDGLHPYNDPNEAFFNCYSAWNRFRGIRADYMQFRCELAYCYLSRNARPLYVNQIYSMFGIHHIIVDAVEQYGLYVYKSPHMGGGLWNIKWNGTRYGLIEGYSHSKLAILRSTHRQATAYHDASTSEFNQAGSYWGGFFGRNGNEQSVISLIDNNFEEGVNQHWSYYARWTWDSSKNAWHFERRYSNDYYPIMEDSIYVPPNTTLKARFILKKKESDYYGGFQGSNYPRAYLSTSHTRQNWGSSNNASATEWISMGGGGHVVSNAIDISGGDWVTTDLTAPAVEFGRFINVGVWSNNRTMAEGYYVKPFQIILDSNVSYDTQRIQQHKITWGKLAIKSSLDDQVIHLGGGIS